MTVARKVPVKQRTAGQSFRALGIDSEGKLISDLIENLPNGDTGNKGPDGNAGGSTYFDTVNPATVAELNTAIANCTKPTLYVTANRLVIPSMAAINNKSGLRIIGSNTELVLSQWNSGTQGICVDLQGTLNDVLLQGFRLNCLLPATSGDGGGYGLVAARGTANLKNVRFKDCYFTTPFINQNAFSVTLVGWGGTGTVDGLYVEDCEADKIKRMFFEITNQFEPYNTAGTKRFKKVRVLNSFAKDLGCNDGQYGMFFSADGPGEDCEVAINTIINPFRATLEAVGTSDVRFIKNDIDYEAGYNRSFSAFSFTDGNHGANFGPTGIKVVGGKVRSTDRGIVLRYASGCSFSGVDLESRKGNTLWVSPNNSFISNQITGLDTNEYLFALQQASTNNTFDYNKLTNELNADGSGGRCLFVMMDGTTINNKIRYNRLFQEKNTAGAFYENSILDFSTGANNVKLRNQSNNPAGL